MGRGGYLGGGTVIAPRSGWFTFAKRSAEPPAHPWAKAARSAAARRIARRWALSCAADAATRGPEEQIRRLREQLREAQRRRAELAGAATRARRAAADAVERRALNEHIRQLTELIQRLET
jgi:uncharacterized membrane protein